MHNYDLNDFKGPSICTHNVSNQGKFQLNQIIMNIEYILKHSPLIQNPYFIKGILKLFIRILDMGCIFNVA